MAEGGNNRTNPHTNRHPYDHAHDLSPSSLVLVSCEAWGVWRARLGRVS